VSIAGRIVREELCNVGKHSAQLGLQLWIAIQSTTWVGHPVKLFLKLRACSDEFVSFGFRHGAMWFDPQGTCQRFSRIFLGTAFVFDVRFGWKADIQVRSTTKLQFTVSSCRVRQLSTD